MILQSRDVVLNPTFVIDPNNPLIAWRNYIRYNNVFGGEADPNHPVSNLGNPATNNWWLSTSLDEHFIQIDIIPDDLIDYLAFARHNFGSGSISIRIDAKTVSTDYETVFAYQNLDDDEATVLQFTPGFYNSFRVYFNPNGDTYPQAAVMYLGQLMQMPVGVPVGHVSIIDAGSVRATSGITEGGDFLGKIVLSETRSNSIDFHDIDATWYDTYMRDFIDYTKENPWFLVWAPVDYPREVGYVWTTNSPRASHSRETGYKSITLQLMGVTD